MTTMTDVARTIGVSIQTVSAVVNDKPGIPEATRRRVQRAIAELDYHPNGLASSQRSQRSLTVGVLIPSITNPYWPGIVRGAEDVAHRNGYSILLCNTDGGAAKHLTYVRLLRRQRVASLFFMSGDGGREEWKIVEQLVANGVPVALGGGDRPGERIVTFDVDDCRGSYNGRGAPARAGPPPRRRDQRPHGRGGHRGSHRRLPGCVKRTVPRIRCGVDRSGWVRRCRRSGRRGRLDAPARSANRDRRRQRPMRDRRDHGPQTPGQTDTPRCRHRRLRRYRDGRALRPLADHDCPAALRHGRLRHAGHPGPLAHPRPGGQHTVFDTQLVVRRSTVMSSASHDEEPRPGATTRNRTP